MKIYQSAQDYLETIQDPMINVAETDNFEVSDEEINIGISVKKGNTELLNKLNSALSELDTTDFEEMMNTAISVQPLSE